MSHPANPRQEAAIDALVERIGDEWVAERVRKVRASNIYWVRGGRRHPVAEALALSPYPERIPGDLIRQHEALARLAFMARDVVQAWDLLLVNHGSETALLNELQSRDGFEAVAFEAFVGSLLRSAGHEVQAVPVGNRRTPEFLIPMGKSLLAVECKARLPDNRTDEFLSSVEEIAQVLASRGKGEWTVQLDCDVAVSDEHAERAKDILLEAQRRSTTVNEVIEGSVWVRAKPERSGLLEHPSPGPSMRDIDLAVAGTRGGTNITVYARRTAEWPRLRIGDALSGATDQLQGFDAGLLCIGPASSVWQPLVARSAYIRAARRELDELNPEFEAHPEVSAVAMFARGIQSDAEGTCVQDIVLLTGVNPIHPHLFPQGFNLLSEDAVLEYLTDGDA